MDARPDDVTTGKASPDKSPDAATNSRGERRRRFWTALFVLAVVNFAGWAFFAAPRSAASDDPAALLITDVHGAPLRTQGWFRVRFDQDLFAGRAEGDALAVPPLGIEPPLAGSWRVDAANALRFESAEQPSSGRRFTLRWSGAHAASRTRAGALAGTVETDPLTLVDTSLIEAENGVATVRVQFDDDVEPSSLLDATTCLVDGDPVDALCDSEVAAKEIDLRVPAGAGSTIELRIDGALRAPGAKLGLGRSERHRFDVPIAFAFVRADASSGLDGSGVQLRFSRRLDPRATLPTIRVEPSVGALRTSTSWRGIDLAGAFEAGRSYRVLLDGPVLARDGSRAFVDSAIDVAMPALRPNVRLQHGDGRLAADGNLELRLRHAGVDRIRVEVRHVPEEAIGLLAAGLSPSSTSDRLVSRDLSITPATTRARDAVLQLRPLLEETGRTRGTFLVRVRPLDGTSSTRSWYAEEQLITVGDLVPTVRTVGNDVVVRVARASETGGVGGARVRAWDRLQRVLAEETTDHDGIARFRVDDAEAITVVTIAHGSDDDAGRETTWLDAPTDLRADAAFGGDAWPDAVEVAMYAESDIVRPGEDIEIGLVARADAGTLPVDLPVELFARRPDGRTVPIATVSTDARHGHAGRDVRTRHRRADWTLGDRSAHTRADRHARCRHRRRRGHVARRTTQPDRAAVRAAAARDRRAARFQRSRR